MADFEEALNALLADPDAMGQILSLAGKLEGQTAPSPGCQPREESPAPAGNSAPLPDPGQLEQMTRLFRLFQTTGSTSGEAAALLSALRPFLQKERQQKLDRALRLAQLSQTARQAYDLWKEGELHL